MGGEDDGEGGPSLMDSGGRETDESLKKKGEGPSNESIKRKKRSREEDVKTITPGASMSPRTAKNKEWGESLKKKLGNARILRGRERSLKRPASPL